MHEAGREKKNKKPALQFWECKKNVSSAKPIFMLMLFLQHQNLCVVSNFILLWENEVIGAKTECICFFRPSVLLAVTGFHIFGKCKVIVPSLCLVCWKQITSVGFGAEPACAELKCWPKRGVLSSEGSVPERRKFLAEVIINVCLYSPLVSEHAEHWTWVMFWSAKNCDWLSPRKGATKAGRWPLRSWGQSQKVAVNFGHPT